MKQSADIPTGSEYAFLIPEFIAAMNDIGRHGHAKYAEQSFQARRAVGDNSRGSLLRTQPTEIARHAQEHFAAYLAGEMHDHFGTRQHQLAAVAFNAMMEFYFAGLVKETLAVVGG